MPFQIVRNDIVNMRVDAIVNTANPKPRIGYGVDTAVHHRAGPQLLEARKVIGNIAVGDAALTPGFALPAKYVIHAVGPVWQGGSHGEAELLRRCYDRSLALAKAWDCESIAFPLLSAGNHGFPKALALEIARTAIREFLEENEMLVYLVVFSGDAFRLSESLFREVASFIDSVYVQQANLLEYGVADKCAVRGQQQTAILEAQRRRQMEVRECMPMAAPSAPPQKPKKTLADLLKATDKGFSETLLDLIAKTGKKDSEIYTRANVSRQHFSKIRGNKNYRPTKATALAFAIALELDLEQTKDLIGRAGYALTNSSKADVILMYFIGRGKYDLYEINMTLFEFDQPLLGA